MNIDIRHTAVASILLHAAVIFLLNGNSNISNDHTIQGVKPAMLNVTLQSPTPHTETDPNQEMMDFIEEMDFEQLVEESIDKSCDYFGEPLHPNKPIK